MKNQRSWLNRYLGEALGGELQIHKNGAFFVLDEESRFGLVHPREAAIPEAALLLCGQLREQVAAGVYPRQEDDTVFLTRREFQQELAQCRQRCGAGWGRRLRELPLEKLVQELTAYMAGWMLLEERAEGVVLCPAVGKWTGHYPARYQGGPGEEAGDEPLETEPDQTDAVSDLIRDEPIAAYENLKRYLTEEDKADIATLIRLRAEINQGKQ